MKSAVKYIGIGLAVVAVIIALAFTFGWAGVGFTKTVGKAQQDARREVFEHSQSYVEGKRQEALKYRLEYTRADSDADRRAIQSTIVMAFANFDENLLDGELRTFIHRMKY